MIDSGVSTKQKLRWQRFDLPIARLSVRPVRAELREQYGDDRGMERMLPFYDKTNDSIRFGSEPLIVWEMTLMADCRAPFWQFD